MSLSVPFLPTENPYLESGIYGQTRYLLADQNEAKSSCLCLCTYMQRRKKAENG